MCTYMNHVVKIVLFSCCPDSINLCRSTLDIVYCDSILERHFFFLSNLTVCLVTKLKSLSVCFFPLSVFYYFLLFDT